MSFRAYFVSIGFTCCHCLSAKSTCAEANALLIDCFVIFCLSLNRCSHPLKHLKSILIFRGYIISLHFQLLAIHCGILLCNMAEQSNSLFCALLCFALPMNPHEFLNITPFQRLLFNTILDF
jgi:hypothetical protein